MANRFTNPAPQFFDNSGLPLTGGTLGFYGTGTTTVATVYTDRLLSIPAQNPLPLDSAGRMSTDVFLDPSVTYKAILTSAAGIVIWTKDPVVDLAANLTASLKVYAGNPNGNVAGSAGTVGGLSASQIYDITNNILYVCTTTGTSTTAVWTAVVASFTGSEDVHTSDYTVLPADAGRIQTANKASAITFSLTAAVSVGAAKLYTFKNIGAGALTITPLGGALIDGVSSYILNTNQAILVECTGSAWRILASYDGSAVVTYLNGSVSAAGSANALTATTGFSVTSTQVTKLRLMLKATATNTSSTVTLAVDGNTARNIKCCDGSALWVGAIQNGQFLDLIYNSATNEWWAANISPALQYPGFRNILRANGGLEIWQRGAGGNSSIAVAASAGSPYTADRWYLGNGANQASVVSAQGGIASGSQLCAQVQRNSGQTGTGAMTFGYPLDNPEAVAIQGQLVTLSFTLQTGANWSPASGTLSVIVAVGTSGTAAKRGGGFTGETLVINSSVSLAAGGGPTRFTLTSAAVVPGTTQQGEVQFVWTPVGTAGTNDWFEIDDVQLETGVAASAFERLNFLEQLLQCLRHFFKTFAYSIAPAQNAGSNTGQLNGIAGKAGAASDFLSIRYPIHMRSAPTVTTYNPAAANAQVRNESGGVDHSATTTLNSNPFGVTVQSTGNAGTAVGDLIVVHLTADAGI